MMNPKLSKTVSTYHSHDSKDKLISKFSDIISDYFSKDIAGVIESYYKCIGEVSIFDIVNNVYKIPSGYDYNVDIVVDNDTLYIHDEYRKTFTNIHNGHILIYDRENIKSITVYKGKLTYILDNTLFVDDVQVKLNPCINSNIYTHMKTLYCSTFIHDDHNIFYKYDDDKKCLHKLCNVSTAYNLAEMDHNHTYAYKSEITGEHNFSIIIESPNISLDYSSNYYPSICSYYVIFIMIEDENIYCSYISIPQLITQTLDYMKYNNKNNDSDNDDNNDNVNDDAHSYQYSYPVQSINIELYEY